MYKIGELRVISDKFSVREFAIEIPGQYPQIVQFQCANKKLDLIDDLNVGDSITVHFNLRGRETPGRNGNPARIWNSLDCWRIEKAPAAAPPSASAGGGDDAAPF